MSIVHQSLVQWRCIRWFHIWRKTFHEPHIYLRVSQLDGDWWTCPRRTTRQLNTEPLAKWGLGGYLGITKSQETVENCVDAGRDNKTVIGSHEAWLQQWWWDRWYEWLTPLLALYLGHGLRLEWGWSGICGDLAGPCVISSCLHVSDRSIMNVHCQVVTVWESHSRQHHKSLCLQ